MTPKSPQVSRIKIKIQIFPIIPNIWQVFISEYKWKKIGNVLTSLLKYKIQPRFWNNSLQSNNTSDLENNEKWCNNHRIKFIEFNKTAIKRNVFIRSGRHLSIRTNLKTWLKNAFENKHTSSFQKIKSTQFVYSLLISLPHYSAYSLLISCHIA